MRLDNWQNNVTSLIEKRKTSPFDFPTFNCLLWALEVIEAVTGKDYSVDYKGHYKTEKEAVKLLKSVDNVTTSQALIELKLNQKAQPVAFARIGDIVLVDPNDVTGLELPGGVRLFGLIPGVCYGTLSYFVGENGLLDVETLRLNGAIWVS